MANSIQYNGFKNQYVALLIEDTYQVIDHPDWIICNLDEYYNNLDTWCPEDADPLDALFSNPIIGIKQNLANKQDLNVGIAGNILKNNTQLLNKLTEIYNQAGYLVIIVGKDTRFLYPTKVQNKVKINMRSVNA